jgi:hypothetical protein
VLLLRALELEHHPTVERKRMNLSVARKPDDPKWLVELYDSRQRVRWTLLIRIYVRRTRTIGRGPRSVIWMQAALRRWRLIYPLMSPRRAGA